MPKELTFTIKDAAGSDSTKITTHEIDLILAYNDINRKSVDIIKQCGGTIQKDRYLVANPQTVLLYLGIDKEYMTYIHEIIEYYTRHEDLKISKIIYKTQRFDR